MQRLSIVVLLAAVGCGGDSSADARPVIDARQLDYSCAGVPDPDTIPDIVTVSGTVFKPGLPGISADAPIEGALIQAFEVGNTSELSRTFSAADGSFTLSTGTDGVPAQTYLRASANGFIDFQLFPPRPVAGNSERVELALFDDELLGQTEARLAYTLDRSKALVIAGVVDCELYPVAGATVTTSPEPGALFYQDSIGFPSPDVSETSLDGFVFLLDVPVGDLTINGEVDGMSLRENTAPVTALSGNRIYGVGLGP